MIEGNSGEGLDSEIQNSSKANSLVASYKGRERFLYIAVQLWPFAFTGGMGIGHILNNGIDNIKRGSLDLTRIDLTRVENPWLTVGFALCYAVYMTYNASRNKK